MRPETVVYGTMASVLRNYTGFDATVEEAATSITIKVKDVPLYGGNRGNVYFSFPRSRISVNGVVKLTNPIESREVRIMTDGKSFPHPHVWDNGVPCWGGANIRDLTSMFEMMVHTLTWDNVTNDSREIGHYTDCECVRQMGVDYERHIRSHKKIMADAMIKRNEEPGQYFVKIFPKRLDDRLRLIQ